MIIGFNLDVYGRYNGGGSYKNLVPLDDMTPQQRYELALSDDENVSIWSDIESFLTDVNDDMVSLDEMWFYKY